MTKLKLLNFDFEDKVQELTEEVECLLERRIHVEFVFSGECELKISAIKPTLVDDIFLRAEIKWWDSVESPTTCNIYNYNSKPEIDLCAGDWTKGDRLIVFQKILWPCATKIMKKYHMKPHYVQEKFHRLTRGEI